MSIEEFNVQYARSVEVVRSAKIEDEYRAQMLDLLLKVRNLVVQGESPEGEGLELMQRIVLSVALEEGKARQAAGA